MGTYRIKIEEVTPRDDSDYPSYSSVYEQTVTGDNTIIVSTMLTVWRYLTSQVTGPDIGDLLDKKIEDAKKTAKAMKENK